MNIVRQLTVTGWLFQGQIDVINKESPPGHPAIFHWFAYIIVQDMMVNHLYK